MSRIELQLGISTVGKLCKQMNILEINLTASGLFGCDEIVARDNVERLTLIFHHNAVLPGLVKRKAGSSGPYVDADPVLEDDNLMLEKVFGSSEGSSPESGSFKGIQ
jgi:hypothetical protein